jgi:hypothetical protein
MKRRNTNRIIQKERRGVIIGEWSETSRYEAKGLEVALIGLSGKQGRVKINIKRYGGQRTLAQRNAVAKRRKSDGTGELIVVCYCGLPRLIN